MYGDPFVSLVLAIVFGIVFYRQSSVPSGTKAVWNPRIQRCRAAAIRRSRTTSV